MTEQRILITGGSGFIGQALINRWLAQGAAVTVLSRRPSWVQRRWGGVVKAVSGFEQLSGQFDVLINLAGEGIADKRWTRARKQALQDSRIALTRDLAAWASRSGQRFRVVLSGSAIGYYGGYSGADDTPHGELDAQGKDFAAQLCADWEAAAEPLQPLTERFLILRTGVVLGVHGGMLKRLWLPFSLGLGGVIGDGQQNLSWIHLQDYCRAVDFLLSHSNSNSADKTVNGVINMTAPHPVTNHDFTQSLARQLQRPALFPMPVFIAKLLFGEMSDLLLKGQDVRPQRLQTLNFNYDFADIDTALKDIVQHW
ncbi:MAG: TIGR01777 family protein [Thalassobium sp.]|nr:MAG: TIGR01777 family protein [Thalassobium sp.]